MDSGIKTVYVPPLVFTAHANTNHTVVLRKIDPRCPGPNCPGGQVSPLEANYDTDPEIVDTLVELHYKDYGDGLVWADWLSAPEQMSWASYDFGAGTWDATAKTEPILNGDIPKARDVIEARLILHSTTSA